MSEDDPDGRPAHEAEERHEDPDELDRDDGYEDRNTEARESANPDDHRDEPPHNS